MEGKGWGKCADQHFCLFLLLFKKWVGIAKVVVRIAILVHKIFNTNLGRSSICTSLHYFGGPRHTWYTIHHFFQSSNQSRCKVLLYTLPYYNFSHLIFSVILSLFYHLHDASAALCRAWKLPAAETFFSSFNFLSSPSDSSLPLHNIDHELFL